MKLTFGHSTQLIGSTRPRNHEYQSKPIKWLLRLNSNRRRKKSDGTDKKTIYSTTDSKMCWFSHPITVQWNVIASQHIKWIDKHFSHWFAVLLCFFFFYGFIDVKSELWLLYLTKEKKDIEIVPCEAPSACWWWQTNCQIGMCAVHFCFSIHNEIFALVKIHTEKDRWQFNLKCDI